MPYDKLLEQRRIKSYRAKPREVEQLLQVAARDLVTAEKILPDDLDWALQHVVVPAPFYRRTGLTASSAWATTSTETNVLEERR